MLWSVRTTATKPTGETPFNLVYGVEAVLPVELKHKSPRVLAFDESLQEGTTQDDNLLLEDARCHAVIRMARYQQSLRCYHTRHVRARTLVVGYMVLRRKKSREGLHKLSPMWEGPFLVKYISRPGVASLETLNGDQVPDTWNIQQIRKFYP